MIWFSADLHIGHTKLIAEKIRPFKSLAEQTEALKDNFQCIEKTDTLYLLGDLGWKFADVEDFLKSLKTKEIHFIRGNHDAGSFDKLPFRTVNDLKCIRSKDDNHIIMCHYPIYSWWRRQHGAYHLHGHCHGGIRDHDFTLTNRIMDVGVDVNNFCPVSEDEVIEHLSQIPAPTHHQHGKEI
jgi:calcineurin-like phosphoesterase family protein